MITTTRLDYHDKEISLMQWNCVFETKHNIPRELIITLVRRGILDWVVDDINKENE